MCVTTSREADKGPDPSRLSRRVTQSHCGVPGGHRQRGGAWTKAPDCQERRATPRGGSVAATEIEDEPPGWLEVSLHVQRREEQGPCLTHRWCTQRGAEPCAPGPAAKPFQTQDGTRKAVSERTSLVNPENNCTRTVFFMCCL